MQPKIIIRKAVSTDLKQIIKNNRAMALETENLKLNKKSSQSGVSAVLKDPSKGFYLMAELDGEVAGSLLITYEWSDWRNKNFWWIQSVYTDIKYRNKGVFKKLYKHTCQLAKINGKVCGIRLYVEKDNKTAQMVYNKCKFKQSHYLLYELKILS